MSSASDTPPTTPPSIGKIAQRIHLIRGQRVVLDSDLAAFYGETLGGDQAHSSGSYAGWNSCLPGMAGSVPKTSRFGIGLAGFLGLLK
jgi:hypothetical protein